MADRILVALSGGVDSSVAAALLVEQGVPVEGATLKLWSPEDGCPDPRRSARLNACCSLRDATDAAQVAKRLGIPFHVVDAREAFARRVLEPAVAEYEAGRTPNPCVACNRWLKLGALLEWGRARGLTHLATGHYARALRGDDGRVRLLRAVDRAKDQSYFLYFLTADDLEHVVFPLGELTKPQVREKATALGLVTAMKPESQDLCVPLPRLERPGDLVDLNGAVLGRHRGVAFYTIGQRHGLGTGALARHSLGDGGGPWYVVALDAGANRVVVGGLADLAATGLTADVTAWNGDPPTDDWTPADVQVRYRSRAVPADVRVRDHRLEVRFGEPQRAVTPGQAAVVYRGDEVLGGGAILAATRAPA
jgi:tRNA-specific 2-thiouridylase